MTFLLTRLNGPTIGLLMVVGSLAVPGFVWALNALERRRDRREALRLERWRAGR